MAKTKKSPPTKKATARKATAPKAKKARETTVDPHGYGTRSVKTQPPLDEGYLITKEQLVEFGVDPDTFQLDLYLENNPFAQSSLDGIPDWTKKDYSSPYPTGDPLIPDDEVPLAPLIF